MAFSRPHGPAPGDTETPQPTSPSSTCSPPHSEISSNPFETSRSQTRLICVVADGPKGRVYLSPTERDERIVDLPEPSTAGLEQELAHNPRDIKAPTYGMTRWANLF